MKLVVPDLGRLRLKHVLDVLPVNPVGHVIADVDVTLIANGTHHVHTFIHTATEAIDVGWVGLSVFAHEGNALVCGRRLDAFNG